VTIQIHKILIVEDVQVVADLQILMLIRAGIAFESRRVETAEDFTRQIELAVPDAILYSASMPHFSGFVALAKAQSLCPDTPFIFVSGTHSEETAAETRKRATAECVFTTSLADLPSTFDRAIKEAEERKKRKAQESAITRLSRMYTDQTRELEQLYVQHVTLRNLSRYLRASVKPAEVYATLECFCPQLFQGTNGKLYLVHPPGKHLEAVATWGDKSLTGQTFTMQDCWGLRQSQPHRVRDPQTELLCGHVTADSKSAQPYLCVPLFAEGETLGLLHLRRAEDESIPTTTATSMESYLNPAVALAEETSLALANLKARNSLHEQSIRDSLTGLYNRRFLEEFLLRELARADRKKHPLSIITMDIDHFKRINDSLGHGAGDIVLRRVGLLLQGFVRQSDIACRVGGEEFSVLLPEASMQIATQRAENIRRAVQELKLKYEDHTLNAITISLGVAAFPDHGTTPAALLHAADQALYDAKYRGRDRVESA
jgi:diguanylate cyclase (GGDEF)-like protein